MRPAPSRTSSTALRTAELQSGSRARRRRAAKACASAVSALLDLQLGSFGLMRASYKVPVRHCPADAGASAPGVVLNWLRSFCGVYMGPSLGVLVPK